MSDELLRQVAASAWASVERAGVDVHIVIDVEVASVSFCLSVPVQAIFVIHSELYEFVRGVGGSTAPRLVVDWHCKRWVGELELRVCKPKFLKGSKNCTPC